ncbi:MAG: glycosyltransferase, partial [Paludibacter sp.]
MSTISNHASVLFSTGCLYNRHSGPHLSLQQTVKELVNKNHAVTVVGTKSSSDDQLEQWVGDIHAFRRLGPYSLHYAPTLPVWLANEPCRWDVASLQGVWMHTNRAVSDWCLKHNKPYMITAHGNFNPVALKISSWKKWLARYTFMKPVFDHVNCYQALTEIEYATLRDFGIKKPICIIGNGIDIPDISQQLPIETLIPNIFLKRRTCLYLGRLYPIKGIDRLIRAWAHVSPGNDWQLIIAGDGGLDYKSELEFYANQAGCHNIHFVGPVYDALKSAWLRQAEFMVLPSHSEAFPMAVLEAFSFGCPALLTSTCGLPIAANVGAALEVASSEDCISQGLLTMIEMSDVQRKQMGDNAIVWVQQQYSLDVVIDQLTSVYDWLCGYRCVPDCIR